MAAFNKSIFVGNLCSDPTSKELGEKGTLKCSFRIAVNNPRNEEEVLYMNVAAWSGLAEVCSKYLKKGSSVLVEGRIRQSKMDNDSYWTEVVADTVQFLSKTKTSESNEIEVTENIEDVAF
tara:strand:+ start:81 stop:443 length:363 start_codon:yes stop_codon:yes gene_type:complete